MKVVEKLSLVLLLIGMIALLVIMVFVNTDIIARYVFSKPIAGSPELVALLLAIVSFFSLALPQFRKRHITISVVIDMASPRVRIYIDAILSLISAIFTILIIWQTFSQGVADLQANIVSATMVIPNAPFRFAAAFGTVFLFLAFVSDFISCLAKMRKEANPQVR
jgi:TRAP-type C4-dicarboxylate transport system permease small subunit